MNSFTSDCGDVFRSVESVQHHFIMEWKNALTHFDTFPNKVYDTTNELFDDYDADTDEEDRELELDEEDQDFCIFQIEL